METPLPARPDFALYTKQSICDNTLDDAQLETRCPLDTVSRYVVNLQGYKAQGCGEECVYAETSGQHMHLERMTDSG